MRHLIRLFLYARAFLARIGIRIGHPGWIFVVGVPFVVERLQRGHLLRLSGGEVLRFAGVARQVKELRLGDDLVLIGLAAACGLAASSKPCGELPVPLANRPLRAESPAQVVVRRGRVLAFEIRQQIDAVELPIGCRSACRRPPRRSAGCRAKSPAAHRPCPPAAGPSTARRAARECRRPTRPPSGRGAARCSSRSAPSWSSGRRCRLVKKMSVFSSSLLLAERPRARGRRRRPSPRACPRRACAPRSRCSGSDRDTSAAPATARGGR